MEMSCAFMGYTYGDSSGYKVTFYMIATILLALALPTVVANTAIISAIIYRRELHTPAFLVIGNLAISDWLAGALAYTCYSIVCIRLALGYDPCQVAYVGTPLAYIVGLTSYNTIALQTVERYLAVFYPYWYHEKLTPRVVIMANVSTWFLSIGLVTFWLITKDNRIFNGVLATLSFVSFCITMMSYFRIFREVRKIERQIKEQEVRCSSEQKKMKSESKVAKATVIILLAVAICYTPLLIFEFFVAFVGTKNRTALITMYWWWFLAIANSSINPYIACRQLSVLRRSVKSMFRWLPFCKDKIDPFTVPTSFAQTKNSQIDLRKVSLFPKK